MREQTIEEFLHQLAAKVPAPGGGATAALHVAQAAALVGMVARYSSGRRYAEHADLIGQITESADAVRDDAVALAADDAAAFSAVADAYALPKSTEQDMAARRAAIADALAGAAVPPAAVIAAAARALELAERLYPVGNPNVATDIGAAAAAVHAGAVTARLNVEVNLTGMTDEARRAELAATLAQVDELLSRCDRLVDAVRTGIAG